MLESAKKTICQKVSLRAMAKNPLWIFADLVTVDLITFLLSIWLQSDWKWKKYLKKSLDLSLKDKKVPYVVKFLDYYYENTDI